MHENTPEMDAEILDVSLRSGTYRAHLRLADHSDPAQPPALALHHRGTPLPEVEIAHQGGTEWALRAPLPARLLNDGVETVHLVMGSGTTILHGLPICAGETLHSDLVAEVALLRDEIEILKGALRRLITEQGQ